MLSIALLALVWAPDRFKLDSGDRVLFYGDSITQAGRFSEVVYPEWVEAYTLTRFPERNVRFANVGWPGDTTWGGEGGSSEDRIRRDVKPFHPTVVSIMLGMNDAGYVAYDARIAGIFREWYGKVAGWMLQAAPSASYTVIRTSPYDNIVPDPGTKDAFTASMIRLPYNDILIRFGTVVQDLAKEHGWNYADFNDPLVKVLREAKTEDPAAATEFFPDGIHPTVAGHLAMAAELLESWGASPLVSDITIDAATNMVVHSENAQVTGLSGLAWTSQEGALPFPLLPRTASEKFVTRAAHLRERLSEERLTVLGLTPGKYQLAIDGKDVAAFDGTALANGVNLTEYETPMLRQSMEVLDLTLKRNRMRYVRWHDVEWALRNQLSPKKGIAGLEDLEEQLIALQHRKAKPLAHRFSLRKIP